VGTTECWRLDADDKRAGPLTAPPHKLTEEERQALLESTSGDSPFVQLILLKRKSFTVSWFIRPS
jgi:hypothetical protein